MTDKPGEKVNDCVKPNHPLNRYYVVFLNIMKIMPRGFCFSKPLFRRLKRDILGMIIKFAVGLDFELNSGEKVSSVVPIGRYYSSSSTVDYFACK